MAKPTAKRSSNARPKQYEFLSDSLRRVICEYKRDNLGLNQTQIAEWVKYIHGLDITQATVSNTLAKSAIYLGDESTVDSATKSHRKVKYPLMERALLAWVHANEESVDMTGDLIREKARKLFLELYPSK